MAGIVRALKRMGQVGSLEGNQEEHTGRKTEAGSSAALSTPFMPATLQEESAEQEPCPVGEKGKKKRKRERNGKKKDAERAREITIWGRKTQGPW